MIRDVANDTALEGVTGDIQQGAGCAALSNIIPDAAGFFEHSIQTRPRNAELMQQTRDREFEIAEIFLNEPAYDLVERISGVSSNIFAFGGRAQRDLCTRQEPFEQLGVDKRIVGPKLIEQTVPRGSQASTRHGLRIDLTAS